MGRQKSAEGIVGSPTGPKARTRCTGQEPRVLKHPNTQKAENKISAPLQRIGDGIPKKTEPVRGLPRRPRGTPVRRNLS